MLLTHTYQLGGTQVGAGTMVRPHKPLAVALSVGHQAQLTEALEPH